MFGKIKVVIIMANLLCRRSIDDDQRKAPRCRVHGASTSSDVWPRQMYGRAKLDLLRARLLATR